MKNYMKKIIIGFLSFAFLLVGQNAFASVTWNTAGNDCQTIAIANHTTGAGWGSPCWTGTSYASPGDTINVRIYYHNTGTSTAENTHIILNSQNGSSTSHSFSGQITSNQGGLSFGPTAINISTAQNLTFGSVIWYTGNTNMIVTPLLNGQNGQEILTSSGLNIGDITAGWPSQGSVVVSFVVGNTVQQTCAITSNLSANPTSIQSGGSSTLSWNTTNCASVNVSGPNFNSSSASGPQTVTPPTSAGTYTYTLTATSSNGSYVPTQTATITVNQNVQTCVISNFTANGTSNTTINTGGVVNLVWNTSNCASVSVLGPNFSNNSLNYNNSIYPTVSGAYVLTATSLNGTYIPPQSVYVTINANVQTCVISNFTANGSSTTNIQSGGLVTLLWNTNNCTSVSVTGSNFSSYATSGNQPVYPTISGTYILTATGANGYSPVTQSVYVNVNSNQYNNCYITNFTANGSSTANIQSGGLVNLVWNTTGNCSVSVTGPNFSSYSTSGNQPVYPTYSGTYTLVVSGSGSGTQTQSVYVNVNNVQYNNCAISYFTASPTTVNYGSPSTLSWSTNNCSSISVTNLGSVNSYGSQIVYPTYTTTYVLTAYGTNGGQQSQSVTVSVNNYVQPVNPVYNTCAVTGVATNITRNSVTLNGILTNSNSYSANTYFEYGTDVTLGSQTNSRSANGNNSFSETVTGLSADTIYFYRLVSNCGNGGISRGSIEIFQTTGAQTNTTTIIRQGTTVIGSESPIMLKIENRYQSFRVGDSVDYTITYKNISSRTLTHPILQVILPKGVTYLNSSRGTYSSDTYTLTVSLEDLVPKVEGTVYVQGKVDSINSGNAQIVTTALLVYTSRNGAQENAIAYVLNNPITTTGIFLGAAALFGSMFGMGIIGWMILLILILLAILLFRKIYRKEQI